MPSNSVQSRLRRIVPTITVGVLTGEQVFDVDHGIDYLASRGDVEMKRVGVIGNSGGGVVSTYAAAVLPKIRFAMPSCAFYTYRESIMSASFSRSSTPFARPISRG